MLSGIGTASYGANMRRDGTATMVQVQLGWIGG